MRYNFKVEPADEHLTLNDLKDGELAIVTDEQEFASELFFKNVAGLHSISRNRYWPSEYAQQEKMSRGNYVGPMSLRCRRIVPGDTLRIEEAK